jgi:hypothetical protein
MEKEVVGPSGIKTRLNSLDILSSSIEWLITRNPGRDIISVIAIRIGWRFSSTLSKDVRYKSRPCLAENGATTDRAAEFRISSPGSSANCDRPIHSLVALARLTLSAKPARKVSYLLCPLSNLQKVQQPSPYGGT